MLVIPAIDLRGGRCVRLRQGDYDRETVFSEDPVAVAGRWVEQGAERLHLVDLDGAKSGQPVNHAVIADIVASTDVPCQLGGGLRDEATLRSIFELGVEWAIVGTRAVRDSDWFASMAETFPDRLVLGLDAKDGMVATEGWLDVSETNAVDLARTYDPLPLAAIVYTDIAKDGMMSGPNFDATERLDRACRAGVIASGGVTTVDDVLELRRRGIGACILGRTLYEGTLQLPALLHRLGEEIDAG